LFLGACDFSPTKTTIEQPADIVAVTVPENLAAGQYVYVYIHWFQVDCGSVLGTYSARQEGPRSWVIEAIDSRPTDMNYGCADGFNCYPYVDSLLLPVPASGTNHYRLAAKRGSIPFDLAAHVASEPEHRITVFHAASGAPYAALDFGYWDGSRDPILTSRTDSTGSAVVAPAPGGTPILSFQNRIYPCGFGTVFFNGLIRPLYREAFHTVVIYEPESIAATPSM